MPGSHSVPLDSLRTGQWADVAEVTGEAGLVGRLAELGIRSGSRLRIIRAGRPCVLEVAGTRFSWRGDANVQVLVQPILFPTEQG